MEQFESDETEVRGQVTNCPQCMGKCELAGGLEQCDCSYCGTKVIEQE